MRSNLFISEGYDGISKKVADILALVIGYGKSVDINDDPIDMSKYNNIILVFNCYGFNTGKKLKKYLAQTQDILKSKKIAIIGIKSGEKDINNYVTDIEESMDRKADIIDFVQGEIKVDKLTEEDKIILKTFFKKRHMKLEDMEVFEEKEILQVASKLSRILNKPDKEMNRRELIDEINKFITSHNTCTLATGSGDFVRNTPIEYTFYKDNIYFISEGGFKFKGILQNPNVCIAIFNNYTSMKELKGMQISGESQIIDAWSNEYIELMKFKGLNIEVLKNLPVNLNLIKVVPHVFEFLNTDFKEKGMDSKQYYFVD